MKAGIFKHTFRISPMVLLATLLYSCVKPTSEDPVPVLEFKDFKAGRVGTRDTAVLLLGYEDGDGDLFVDLNEQGPNLILTPYMYSATKKQFLAGFDRVITNDTFRIPITVKQPADGYYKGKAIKGEITIPLTEFRSGDSVKIFKYTFFMKDLKQHYSNTVATPVYSVDF